MGADVQQTSPLVPVSATMSRPPAGRLSSSQAPMAPPGDWRLVPSGERQAPNATNVAVMMNFPDDATTLFVRDNPLEVASLLMQVDDHGFKLAMEHVRTDNEDRNSSRAHLLRLAALTSGVGAVLFLALIVLAYAVGDIALIEKVVIATLSFAGGVGGGYGARVVQSN